jgi:hypothetical protein
MDALTYFPSQKHLKGYNKPHPNAHLFFFSKLTIIKKGGND